MLSIDTWLALSRRSTSQMRLKSTANSILIMCTATQGRWRLHSNICVPKTNICWQILTIPIWPSYRACGSNGEILVWTTRNTLFKNSPQVWKRVQYHGRTAGKRMVAPRKSLKTQERIYWNQRLKDKNYMEVVLEDGQVLRRRKPRIVMPYMHGDSERIWRTLDLHVIQVFFSQESLTGIT